MAAVQRRQEPLPAAGPSNPVKAFGGYLEAVNSAIRTLVAAFEEQRLVQNRQDALTQHEIDVAVEAILEQLPAYDNGQEVVRSSLEKSLEAMVLNMVRCTPARSSLPRALLRLSEQPSLISGQWADDSQHFLLYYDALDIMLNVMERQLVDGGLAMQTLEYLFEAMPIHKADLLFAYLETRRQLLTKVRRFPKVCMRLTDY